MSLKTKIVLTTIALTGTGMFAAALLGWRGHGVMAATAAILTLIAAAITLNILIEGMISRPLRALRGSMHSAEKGILDESASISGHGEISDLGNTFNNMLDSLRNTHEEALNNQREDTLSEGRETLEDLNSQLTHKVKEVEAANNAVMSLSRELKHKNVELSVMVQRLQGINEIGNMLASVIDQTALLKLIVKTSVQTLKTRKGQIYIKESANVPIAINYIASIDSFREHIDASEVHSSMGEIMKGGRIMINNMDSASNPVDGKAIGVPMSMRGQVIGAILLEDKSGEAPFTEDELELLDTLSNQAVVALENSWLYETVKNNYFGTIQSLVNALEASDRYTKGHSERVRLLVTELARKMELEYSDVEMLEHAAILHDIGKIGIDTEVLNKADTLSDTEFSLIRAHPIIGDEILGPIGTLKEVRTIILQHHERWDGKGYPYSIAGEAITLKARLLAVVDTFDAMLTDRPYRKARRFSEVIDELRQGAGTQFDPKVVKSFLSIIEDNNDMLSTIGYSVEVMEDTAPRPSG